MQIFAMKKILENFGTYLSVLTFSVLCAGYFNLKLYYLNFAINIEDYISASEILMLSLPSLFTIFLYLFFPALIVNILIKDFENYTAKYLPIDKWSKQKKVLYPTLITGILTILLAFSLIFTSPNIWREIISELLNFLLPITGAFLLSHAFVSSKLGVDPKLFKIGFGIMILTVLFSVFFQSNKKKVRQIKKGENTEYLIFFNNKDTLLETSDSINLIGRTDKYFFFFNNRSVVTTIVSSSEVTSISKYLLNRNSASVVSTNSSQRNPEYNSWCSIICITGKLLHVYGFIELKTFLLLCPRKEIIGNQ